MIILITVKVHYGAKTVIGFLVFDYKSKYGEYCQQLSQYFDNSFKLNAILETIVANSLKDSKEFTKQLRFV